MHSPDSFQNPSSLGRSHCCDAEEQAQEHAGSSRFGGPQQEGCPYTPLGVQHTRSALRSKQAPGHMLEHHHGAVAVQGPLAGGRAGGLAAVEGSRAVAPLEGQCWRSPA